MNDMMELNKSTLNRIWKENPTSVEGMRLEGTYLVYGGKKVDIGNFDISRLLYEVPGFNESLSVLSPDDLFKIIKLHAEILGKEKNNSKDGKNIAKDVEIIKMENPLLKNITTVSRSNGVGTDEYINVVDSYNNDHLFKIEDKGFDFLSYYEQLRATKSDNITPEDLVHYMNYRFREIRLDGERNFENKSNVSEDFANKMDKIGRDFRDDSSVMVSGNEKEDIAILRDGDSHEIKTFDHNQNGDLVINNHSQNVSGVDTTTKVGDTSKVTSRNEVDDVKENKETTSNNEVAPNEQVEDVQVLIPLDDFKKLFKPGVGMEFSESERRNVDLWYAYFADLLLYEEYLLPELRDILNDLRNFVLQVECSVEDPSMLNKRQTELVNKRNELQENKSQVLSSGNQSQEKVEERIKKLKLQYPNDTGSITTLQVIGIIVGVAIILTAITLYIIG